MKKLLGVIGAVGLVLLAVTGASGGRSEAHDVRPNSHANRLAEPKTP